MAVPALAHALMVAITFAMTPLPVSENAEMPLVTSTNSEPLALGASPTRVTLAAPSGGPAGATFAERIRALPPATQVYLVVEHLSVTAPTTSGYEVDLGLGQDGLGPAGEVVGNFNFFDVQSDRRDVAFNITDLVRGLARKGALGDSPTVTFVPTSPPEEGTGPAIDRVVIVAVPP
jgi:hypothetical protein